MRILKPLVSVLMALLIGVTSLGLSVSAHTCTSSGYSETSFAPLKACCAVPAEKVLQEKSCCKLPPGKGFQAVPCCKLSIHHVKLPTVRQAVTNVDVPLNVVLPVPALAAILFPRVELTLPAFKQSAPPESPPLATGRDIQTQFRRFLI